MTSAPRRPDFHHSPAPRSVGYPASTRALAYWESLRDDLVELIVEAGNAGLPTDGIIVPRTDDSPTANLISTEIDEMKETISHLRGQLRAARRSGSRLAPLGQLVEDRLYETPDGEIYRTVLSGAGNLYAKIWTTDGWEYAAGAIRDIRPEHRMTVERAKELSIKFARCIRCGATLTADESVERGIGPICITKI